MSDDTGNAQRSSTRSHVRPIHKRRRLPGRYRAQAAITLVRQQTACGDAFAPVTGDRESAYDLHCYCHGSEPLGPIGPAPSFYVAVLVWQLRVLETVLCELSRGVAYTPAEVRAFVRQTSATVDQLATAIDQEGGTE